MPYEIDMTMNKEPFVEIYHLDIFIKNDKQQACNVGIMLGKEQRLSNTMIEILVPAINELLQQIHNVERSKEVVK